ncbi:PrgI family protein [Streptomyces sp. B15]|uniref:PrgI family protein n=1 Tax=Streptomyces sp. B15 TaxID=1537797 RepID=UPI001B359338|nr:PrgI family protein [Streptomyces sp. B15]MBQ1123756.1 PrgI family protein [Streptomyces sp. B15]
MHGTHDEGVEAVRIPADVERPDRVLGPFTARQAAQLAAVGLLLYGVWWLLRPYITALAFLAMTTPVAGVVTALVVGRREGIGLDRFLLAALAFIRTPKRQVHAPEGIPPLPEFVPNRLRRAAGPAPCPIAIPAEGVDETGVIDLGADGRAALASCSTVNFALRTSAEQNALTSGFGRWLNSLTGPVQILLTTHRVELAPMAASLREGAPALPHPALEAAARAHADYLDQLAVTRDLTARRHLVIAREPQATSGGRVCQRVHEMQRALAAVEIDVGPLDAERVVEEFADACNPDLPHHRKETVSC